MKSDFQALKVGLFVVLYLVEPIDVALRLGARLGTGTVEAFELVRNSEICALASV